MDATFLHTTVLAPGQRQQLDVRAGTVLVAVRGALRIDESPRWLAETLVPVTACVGEGQAYVVQQAGRVCVSAAAQGETQFAEVAPAGLAARLVQRLLHIGGPQRPTAMAQT